MTEPILDDWFWQFKYDSPNIWALTKIFHVNSMTDKKLEIIDDWNAIIPEKCIVYHEMLKTIRENIDRYSNIKLKINENREVELYSYDCSL